MKKSIISETVLKIVYKSESEDRKYFTLRVISKEELLLENVSVMLLATEDSLVELVENRIWKEMAILPYIPETISLEIHKINSEENAEEENKCVASVDESFKVKYDIQHMQYLHTECNVEFAATRLARKICRELSYYLLTSEILKEYN